MSNNDRKSGAFTGSNGSGKSKVERYGWRTDTRPGVFRMVHKSQLVVDHRYQRDIDPAGEAKIQGIAAEWSWPAFGTLCIAEREDGRLFIVTGQHRKLAADRRADIELLPCMVHRFADLSDEAQAFLDEATRKKPLTYAQRFGALAITNDECAKLVDDLITGVGREYKRDTATSVRCVRRLMESARKDRARLERLWPVIDDICKGVKVTETIVTGLFWLEGQMDGGESLAHPRWRTRLVAIGPTELDAGAKRMAAAFSRGGDRQWGLGLLQVVNKGLKKKLRLRGEASDDSGDVFALAQ